MQRRMRNIKNAGAAAAKLRRGVRLKVKVHVAPENPEDVVDGVPDLEFKVGGPSPGDRSVAAAPALAHLRAPLIVAGGGMQTTLRLSGPSSFMLVSVIKEIHVRKVRISA